MSGELDKQIAAISVAPRVSEADVLAAIADTRFFTASEGVQGSYEGGLDPAEYPSIPLGLFTICIITLKNGFVCMGHSACAAPENYNKEMGEKIALRNATSEAWGHMGYALRDKLFNEQDMISSSLVQKSDPDMTGYIGTKYIHAKPMNRLEYNDLRGWVVPADENPADEGYMVEYTDKLDGQVKGYDGYISWSPKDVFERAYKAV